MFIGLAELTLSADHALMKIIQVNLADNSAVDLGRAYRKTDYSCRLDDPLLVL